MKLFEEFPPVSTEAWMSVVEKDLKGADFEKRLVTKTLDGLKLKPFYRKEDLPPMAPFPTASGNPWILREEIRDPDIEVANRHILQCLERGSQEISIITYPIGPEIRNQKDVERLLEGVWIDAVPIHWLGGPLAIPTLALFVNEANVRDMEARELQGSIDLDPILDRCAGWTEASLDTWREDFMRVTRYILAEMPKFKLLTIRGALLEKSGASLAQEVAFTLSLLVEYLTAAGELFDEGKLGSGDRAAFLSEIVSRSELRFGVGTNYFLEIAKLRAVRILLGNLLPQFGVTGAVPTIHAITTSSNKTLYDPYNNLLRATIEAMAAVNGGADSLSVAAYDQGYHAPDEFSAHLTRNTQSLLKDEAYLDKVGDPLGGSYTVEAITASLAQASWDLFRKVEEKGGFVAAWKEGFIGSELDRIRAERQKQVSRRQRKIVGTTVYSNPAERRLQDVGERPISFQVDRTKHWEVQDYIAHFACGSPIGALFTKHRVPSTALDPFRPSWPFENLRLRVERHAATGGKRPKILLAMWGDKKMSRARSSFCQSFFGAAGYEIAEAVLEDAAALLPRAKAEGCDLAVMCTSDDRILDMARAALSDKGKGAQAKKVPVVVAGYPEPALEELQGLGVIDFVHVRADLLDSLRKFHVLFGIPEIPLDEPLNPEEK
jgi:methylmalonyl-CoA mutase